MSERAEGPSKPSPKRPLARQGNSREFAIRRLHNAGRRDLLDAVVAGMLSLNGAMVAAGFRKSSKESAYLKVFNLVEYLDRAERAGIRFLLDAIDEDEEDRVSVKGPDAADRVSMAETDAETLAELRRVLDAAESCEKGNGGQG